MTSLPLSLSLSLSLSTFKWNPLDRLGSDRLRIDAIGERVEIGRKKKRPITVGRFDRPAKCN